MDNQGSLYNTLLVRNQTTATSGNWAIAIVSSQTIGISKSVGIKATAYTSSPLSSYRSYGLYATAGNATTGWNYGVLTELMGTNNGTALFAASAQGTNEYIPGKFAGYFNGRVYMSERLGVGTSSPQYTLDVNGDIHYTGSIFSSSDVRLKKDITELSSSMKKLSQLRAVSYQFKEEDLSLRAEARSAVQDTGIVVITDLRKYLALEEKKDADRLHIGFIAQEFKEIYPELVRENDKGMLSIDYLSLIPILVQTIQELNKRIEVLENKK
ncbi:MAG: tail fiber domain-containing protein [Bacteroidales bacterium]|jgi:hypothetical protein|nr:tail fiber domain-containing protein [Bacteroidales bacterium]